MDNTPIDDDSYLSNDLENTNNVDNRIPSKSITKSANMVPSDEEYSILLDDDSFEIVIPHSHEAAVYFGRGSQWDTSSRSTSVWFTKYNDSGDLFIITDKNTDEKYQLHVPSKKIADANNYSIECGDFFKQPNRSVVYDTIFNYLQEISKENAEKFANLCQKYDGGYDEMDALNFA